MNFALFSPHGEQKVNVGLNLKFNKKNEEVPGYTKRTEKEWLYSAAVEDLLAEYLERCVCVFEAMCVCLWLHLFLCEYFNNFLSLSLRFSEVFDFIARNSHDDVFYEDDVWPGVDENGWGFNLF